MSPPLTYGPAYIGLFVALLGAVACNAFLDIRYGLFGTEVFLWGVVFAWTVYVGWRQRGVADERGKGQQGMVLLLGAAATIVVFIPMWGFPRAGLCMLAGLQAAQNCVTTTRRQLHLGLLVSIVMVMFAATHYRADWTMLFYIVPYVVAVVFTLVSEQISSRAADLRSASLGQPTGAGQGLAIAAATGTILALTAVLYLATPQVTWPFLQSRYGQPSGIGPVGEPLLPGRSGQGGDLAGGDQGEGSGGAGGGQGEREFAGGLGGGLPTPAQMREAAGRPGMPQWQSTTIRQLADLDEAIQQALAPLVDALEELWNALKEWLQENRSKVLHWLLALLIVALLVALLIFLREIRVLAWLQTRYDYLRLVVLDLPPGGRAGGVEYYRAMERLLALGELPRQPVANAREYLHEIRSRHAEISGDAAEMTSLFEAVRYGSTAAGTPQLQRMRELYRSIFRKLGG
jgi:Ca2+/Na+ antiporter